ncbi:MAG: lysine--tRNA ligase [Terriglobales bacterium]
MALDQEIFEQRLAKLNGVRLAGADPYPRRFAFSDSLAALHTAHDPATAEALDQQRPPVAVCGRLIALRGHGKAGFGHLLQDGSRLQIYVRQDGVAPASFDLWKNTDLGDFLGVHGYLFRTRTGELTVHAQRIELLAKDLLPLPEKWHGLVDIEARYRQRYLDLLVNPPSREIFVRRAHLVEALRSRFHARGYLEVETPMMQPLPGGAAAKPFQTHHAALDLPLYLRIAPELYLKRLVVGGFDRVFEINRNFRNEGISTQHNPEFTMLEFYEAYSDYRVLMDWSEQLLLEIARQVTGDTKVEFRGQPVEFASCRRISLREAIAEFWPAGAGPAPTLPQLADPAQERPLAERFNRFAANSIDLSPVALPPDCDPGVLLMSLFENVAEHHLHQPTIVFDFPLSVSPLAKAKADEPDWVERFELYAGGMEIANGYSELNDPEEQLNRFRQQMRQRERGDQESHALDNDYVRALRYGMPPTAGEGIGIDRLTMLLTGAASIRDVILFPLLRPEGA